MKVADCASQTIKCAIHIHSHKSVKLTFLSVSYSLIILAAEGVSLTQCFGTKKKKKKKQETTVPSFFHSFDFLGEISQTREAPEINHRCTELLAQSSQSFHDCKSSQDKTSSNNG